MPQHLKFSFRTPRHRNPTHRVPHRKSNPAHAQQQPHKTTSLLSPREGQGHGVAVARTVARLQETANIWALSTTVEITSPQVVQCGSRPICKSNAITAVAVVRRSVKIGKIANIFCLYFPTLLWYSIYLFLRPSSSLFFFFTHIKQR